MKLIPLTKGQFAIVDDADYESLSALKWHLRGKYASRETCKNGVVSEFGMHRVIMNPPDNMHVDHINRNTLDNRRQNLRVCTRQQNGFNAGVRRDNTSGYKGVSFHRRIRAFQARITTHSGRLHLGYFPTPESAGAAYKSAAAIHHGEFARTS